MRTLRGLIVGVVILLTVTSLVGCSMNSTNNKDDDIKNEVEVERDSVLDVVKVYNKLVFKKDWKEARKLLTGTALKNFDIQSKEYESNSVLLSQINETLVMGKKFSMVKSKIDYRMIMKDTTNVFSRQWVRIGLIKDKEWKIAFVEESKSDYTGNSHGKNDTIVVERLEMFLKNSAEGNMDEASKLLSGKSRINAEKYKLKSFPKNEYKTIDINVLENFGDECLVNAKYLINGKQNEAMFHMVLIQDKWLINEQI